VCARRAAYNAAYQAAAGQAARGGLPHGVSLAQSRRVRAAVPVLVSVVVALDDNRRFP
jgi:hypothetical protein